MMCDLCHRREEDVTVVIDGKVMLVCQTCMDRAEEADDVQPE